MQLLREQLWNLQSLLYAALLVKLLWAGLWRPYHWFTALVFCQTLQVFGLHLIPQSDPLYFKIYAASGTVIWILTVFVVQEMYGLVFSQYRGLDTWGRRLLLGSACLSVCVALVVLWTTEYQPDHEWEWQRQALLAIEQALALSLAFFLLLLAACLACLPVPLHRTIAAHCAIYFVYFLGIWLNLISLHGSPSANLDWADVALLSLSCLCLTAWLVLMRPMSNVDQISTVRVWRRSEEQFLLNQLDSINRTLVKSLPRRES